MSVRILAVGDVCGQPGLDFLEKRLKEYKKEQNIAFAVVNGENANVVGITPRQADAILRAGVHLPRQSRFLFAEIRLRAPQAPGERTRVQLGGH